MQHDTLRLTFHGEEADQHVADMYDVATAIMGFQRSLAITTHLVINNEVIIKAPSLKNARIYTKSIQKGSITIAAIVVGAAGAGYKIGTAPKDTPLGHAVRSTYDYIVRRCFGVPVDYEKTIYQQMEAMGKIAPTEAKLESVVEKCENPLLEMHRPIIFSQTVGYGELEVLASQPPVYLTKASYGAIKESEEGKNLEDFEGVVSSYNSNTFKGRIYLLSERRPIPFEITQGSRGGAVLRNVSKSISYSIISRRQFNQTVLIRGYVSRGREGRIKSIRIVDVQDFDGGAVEYLG